MSIRNKLKMARRKCQESYSMSMWRKPTNKKSTLFEGQRPWRPSPRFQSKVIACKSSEHEDEPAYTRAAKAVSILAGWASIDLVMKPKIYKMMPKNATEKMPNIFKCGKENISKGRAKEVLMAEGANNLIIDNWRRSPYMFYVLFQSLHHIDEEEESMLMIVTKKRKSAVRPRFCTKHQHIWSVIPRSEKQSHAQT